MHRTPVLPALIAGLVLAGPGRAGDELKPFTSREGKFTVAMPRQPKEQKSTATSARGERIVTNLFVAQVGGDRACIVAYNDYPAGTVTADNKEKLLDSCRNGNVRSMKGKLASEKGLTIGAAKHPGREIVIEAPDGKTRYRARIYLVGDRLYQVVAQGPGDFTTGKDIDAFMESFKLDE